VRRRRECQKCSRRFTTFEYVEKTELVVVKTDGKREPFDITKLLNGLRKACEKRPVPSDVIDRVARNIERDLGQETEREISSQAIGRHVLAHLKDIDHVAYLRFASVYRKFRDLQDFNAEINELMKD